MDDLNKLETVPTLDALVKEEPAIEVEVVELVVEESTTPEPTPAPAPTFTAAPVAPKPVSPKPAKSDDGLVAIHSSKDFVSVSKGYSKVNKDLAETLLKNKNVRLATEEEVRTHLNK